MILGDAAVSANIVSPILIIVVAITGISSFAIPDYSLSFHIRLMRFLYIIFGYLAGFLGIAFCFILHLCVIASINSFSVSYLSPYAPRDSSDNIGYFLSPIWERIKRRNFLHTKRPYKLEK